MSARLSFPMIAAASAAFALFAAPLRVESAPEPKPTSDEIHKSIPASSADLRGVVYSKAWEYEHNGALASLIRGRLDVEGNIVVMGVQGNAVYVDKIDGALDTTPGSVWAAPVVSAFFLASADLAVDFDGNVYATGTTSNGLAPGLIKISSPGFIAWQRRYTPIGNDAFAFDLELSPDGVPFFVTGIEFPRVFQIDPRTGAVAWETALEGPEAEACVPGASLDKADIVVDRRGNVFAYVEELTSGASLVFGINGATGEIRWCTASSLVFPQSLDGDLIATGLDGNVYVAGSIGSSGVVQAFDPETGAMIDQRSKSVVGRNILFEDMLIHLDGSIIVGGCQSISSPGDDAAIVVRFAPDPADDWLTETSTTGAGRVRAIDVGRLGNVYVATNEGSGVGSRTRTSRIKLATDVVPGGTIQWTDLDDLDNGYTNIFPRDIVVDGGGNVYTISAQAGPGASGQQVIKYTQPVELASVRQSACVELKLENRSIWAPTVGSLVAEEDLFTFGPVVNPIWPIDLTLGGSVDTLIFGEYGAELNVDFTGKLDAGIRAEVDGGTADIHFPFDIEWTIPNPDTLNSTGQNVQIETSWKPDPAARLTSCFTPTFNAGLTAGVEYSAFVNVFAEAASIEIFDEDLVDVPNTVIPRDYIPGFSLLDMLGSVGFDPGSDRWVTIRDNKNLITGKFKVPSLTAKSGYSASTNTFMTNVDASEERSRFLDIKASITEAVLQSFGATATFSLKLPRNAADDDDFRLVAGASALQLSTGLTLGVGQRIGVQTVPKIRYTFPNDGGIDDIVLDADQPLDFPLPADKDVDIVPYVETPATFSNMTNVTVFPGITFETLRLGVSASAFGFSVLATPAVCLLCYDWDVSEILDALGLPGDLINLSIPVFDDSWMVNFPTQRLPCIRVVGDLTTTPRLIAASRAAVDMIIYDQTSPSASYFNIATEGVTRMLLYGEEFNNTPTPVTVKIEHNGRIETLTQGAGLTFINESTLLIEMPNIMRLTPGVARIWVQNGFGASETIDLPVEYPIPRLDAVNPNLWAADPDLAVLPISVIDARSFLDNDTYIARRDYYIKMREDLWNTQTAGGLSAQQYFPLFDFDQMPGFPAVLWQNGLVDFEGMTFTRDDGTRIITRQSPEHDIIADLTVEAIIRPDLGANAVLQIVSNRAGGSGGWRFGVNDNGSLRFTTWGVQDYNSSAGMVSDGVWSHVAAVFQNNNATFYVNGQLIQTVNGALPANVATDARIAIGGRIDADLQPTSNSQAFVGEIAEVRLWDGERTPEQIATYVTRPLMGDEPGLLGYWPLDGLVDFGDFGVGIEGPNDVDDRSPINAIGDAVNLSGQTTKVVFPVDVEVAPFPLPRFIQPVDNGIHNVRLTEDLYDRPQIARVTLCNPGPGGGMSNHYDLTIAAPTPVARAVAPAPISPLDLPFNLATGAPEPLELTITGPAHVPTFNGFEEPKFGNFNRDSVVHLDGEPLETTFTDSSTLTALLPHALATLGDHSVTVVTPSNGTQYFEQRFRDLDGDGEPDDENPGTFGVQPYEQFYADSGGTSAPLLFRVRYREPAIESLIPDVVAQNSPAFDDAQLMEARTANLVILGTDFRDGAAVYFGSQVRTSTVLDPTMIEVKLLPEDVASLGVFMITVINQGAQPMPSQPAVFEVIPPAPMPLFCKGDLDGNGCTDVQDFVVFIQRFGLPMEVGHRPDYDADGIVTVIDFTEWAMDYGCAVAR